MANTVAPQAGVMRAAINHLPRPTMNASTVRNGERRWKVDRLASPQSSTLDHAKIALWINRHG